MKRMLADVCPELINEWSQRNLPLTPDTVTHGSNKIVSNQPDPRARQPLRRLRKAQSKPSRLPLKQQRKHRRQL